MATASKNQTPADKANGYRFGVDGFVTKKQAAEFLACSVRKIDLLIDEGKLRKRKDGTSKQAAVRICKRSLLVHAAGLEA